MRKFCVCCVFDFVMGKFESNRYTTSTFNYFSEQGIPGPKPIPIFGNMWNIWKEVRKKNLN
jgi:hypothetical protein